MQKTSFRFTNPRGLNLAAELKLPEHPLCFALFANCFTCTKDYKFSRWLGELLAKQGIAFFSFDFTGLGESQGEFADSNLETMQEDLRAAAEFLRKNFQAPQLWLGYSLGGTAVLTTAGRMEDARAVVTLATPAEFSGFRARLLRQDPQIESRGEGSIEWGGFRFRVKRQLFEQLASVQVEDFARDLAKPWLLLQSPQDEVVPLNQAETLFRLAQEPKALKLLPGLPHLLLKREEIQQVADAILDWLPQYLPALALVR